MEIADYSEQLAQYIRSLPDFHYQKAMETNNHLGATLTDVVFQAGINYQTTVLPRIKKIKAYSTAATISGLQLMFRSLNAEDFFNWKGAKPRNFLSIIDFLAKQPIETENDLKQWLLLPESFDLLMHQPGFGKKSCDYFKILLGIPNVATDRHIFTFLETAGIFTADYDVAKFIVIGSAKILGMSPSELDHSIWWYMAGERKSSREGCENTTLSSPSAP